MEIVMLDDNGLEVPMDCVNDCTTLGDNDAATNFWVNKLNLVDKFCPIWWVEIQRHDFSDIKPRDKKRIAEAYLWLKCWDYKEELK